MRPELPGAYLQLPPASVIQAVQASWSTLRKRARVLLVMDASALSSGVDADHLAQSVSAGLEKLAGDDQVGAWELPGATGSSLTYIVLEPVQPGKADAARIVQEIRSMKRATGGIALYTSLRAAASTLSTNLDPSRINAIVLISAGRSTDPGDAPRFTTLTALTALAGQTPGVHVFTVALGKNADRSNLHLIALEGKGASYDASDPASVSRALAAVISNF
jgi:Ca-activated chloride channel family protein